MRLEDIGQKLDDLIVLVLQIEAKLGHTVPVVGEDERPRLLSLVWEAGSFTLEVQSSPGSGSKEVILTGAHYRLLEYALTKWRLGVVNPIGLIVVSAPEQAFFYDSWRYRLLAAKEEGREWRELERNWMENHRKECNKVRTAQRTAIFSNRQASREPSRQKRKSDPGRYLFMWVSTELDQLDQEDKLQDIQSLVQAGRRPHVRACGYNWKAIEELGRSGLDELQLRGYRERKERLEENIKICRWLYPQLKEKLQDDIQDAERMFDTALTKIKTILTGRPPQPTWNELKSEIQTVAGYLDLAAYAQNFLKNLPNGDNPVPDNREPREIKFKFAKESLAYASGKRLWRTAFSRCYDAGLELAQQPPSVRKERMALAVTEPVWNNFTKLLAWAIYKTEDLLGEDIEKRFVEDALSSGDLELKNPERIMDVRTVHTTPEEGGTCLPTDPPDELQECDLFVIELRNNIGDDRGRFQEICGQVEDGDFDELKTLCNNYLRLSVDLEKTPNLRKYVNGVINDLLLQDINDFDTTIELFDLIERKLLRKMADDVRFGSSKDVQEKAITACCEIDVVQDTVKACRTDRCVAKWLKERKVVETIADLVAFIETR